ncbi:MAG: hypothetical protein ACT4NL_08410 [Pseudomarimonas sp.]
MQLALQVRLPPITPIKRRPILCHRCGQPMRVRVVSPAERMARRSAIERACRDNVLFVALTGDAPW